MKQGQVICGNCKWWNFEVSASQSWGECLNPKVQEACRISAGLVDIPMAYRQEINSYARIRFEETHFGCIYFEEQLREKP